MLRSWHTKTILLSSWNSRASEGQADLSALHGEAASRHEPVPDVFNPRELTGRIQYHPRQSIPHMEQLQLEARARKRKKQARLEFDPAKVFGTSKDAELEIDLEAARYHAQKGQGGDRRA